MSKNYKRTPEEVEKCYEYYSSKNKKYILDNWDKVKLLLEEGWFCWYSDNYWCHSKTVSNLKVQDPTNYGMSIEDAYTFETQGGRPFKGQFLGYMGGLRW